LYGKKPGRNNQKNAYAPTTSIAWHILGNSLCPGLGSWQELHNHFANEKMKINPRDRIITDLTASLVERMVDKGFFVKDAPGQRIHRVQQNLLASYVFVLGRKIADMDSLRMIDANVRSVMTSLFPGVMNESVMDSSEFLKEWEKFYELGMKE